MSVFDQRLPETLAGAGKAAAGRRGSTIAGGGGLGGSADFGL